MGFFDAVGQTFGFGNDTGGEAASRENAFIADAIEEMRRQFGITQENVTPFIEAGQGAVPGLVEGSTAGGLDSRLAEIFNTDIFGELVDERTRAVEGQLSAGGLTRSGGALREIANVPTDIGMGLEQLLTSRLGGLAGSGQNAAFNLGSLGQNNAMGIAGLLGRQGSNVSSGLLADQQAQAKGTSNLINAASSLFFSDPALKKNVEQISTIRDLGVYQWDWIDKAKGTMIEKCGTVGFMADEVKEKYPQHVAEYGGFMVIDYPNLLDELEAA